MRISEWDTLYCGSEEAKVLSAEAKDCASEKSSSSLSEPSCSSPLSAQTSDARDEKIDSDESEKAPVWLLLAGETEETDDGGEGRRAFDVTALPFMVVSLRFERAKSSAGPTDGEDEIVGLELNDDDVRDSHEPEAILVVPLFGGRVAEGSSLQIYESSRSSSLVSDQFAWSSSTMTNCQSESHLGLRCDLSRRCGSFRGILVGGPLDLFRR